MIHCRVPLTGRGRRRERRRVAAGLSRWRGALQCLL